MINKLKSWFFADKNKQESLLQSNIKFRVCVIDFVDNIESENATTLCKQLSDFDNMDVVYYTESFNKSFLGLEPRSLFDWIDKGQDILYKTGADVLIWGYREGANLRLNFQTEKLFNVEDDNFILLLDSLYVPADVTEFPNAIINLIYGAILSSICPADNEVKIVKKYLLKKVINNLSKDNSAKILPVEFMPYVMNFLGVIYLSYAYSKMNEKDFKITQSLFDKALGHQDLINNPLHLGCIYSHLAQLFDTTSMLSAVKPYKFFKGAIENYFLAQKYFNKYNFPYEYGYVCFKLSNMFFAIWKQKNELQSLRDCVFQLREAEKIFTYALFPEFWAQIQGELGYKLSLLAQLMSSAEIAELAIASYKNQQKIVTERTEAIEWAKIQEKIGHIYYQLGKKTDDKALLEEALEYFHDALYIFENAQMTEEVKLLNVSISKSSSFNYNS